MDKKKRGRPRGSTNKTKGAFEKTSKVTNERTNGGLDDRVKDEIWAIVIIALGAFFLVSLQTEAAGQLGIAISIFLKGTFGAVAYVIPYLMILYGLLLFAKKTSHLNCRSIFLLTIIIFSISILNSYRYLGDYSEVKFSIAYIRDIFDTGASLKSGGFVGMLLGSLLVKVSGMPGLFIFCILLIIISILFVINTPLSKLLEDWLEKRRVKREEKLANQISEEKIETNEDINIVDQSTQASSFVHKSPGAAVIDTGTKDEFNDGFGGSILANSGIKSSMNQKQMKIIDYMNDDDLFEDHENTNPKFEEFKETQRGSRIDTNSEKPAVAISIDESGSHKTARNTFLLPSIELLDKAKDSLASKDSVNLKDKAKTLETTLQNFGVNARVIQVTKGPAVTRYEIQPNVGVKVSSIVRLADDIALNLEAKSIRIEAPIPGKAAVGIEVENERVNLVTIREMIESKEYKESVSRISFVVGKNISGTPIISDLKEMPHLLIAGSTGSGKSVCINSIIISILYKSTPDEVKFLLIDPKVVELNHYNGIPHLLIPVVTDPSKAATALNWAVTEMTSRYKRFAEIGVKDLESYNKKMIQLNTPKLHQIVIVIDELADLMMAAPAQVEESICRLAQMARAAGMHLIVATQRPSVDVITGVIKANIPSRISFAVSSQFDSRTILDMAGAERLVGKGDMLFNPLGLSKPIRVQGAFISDAEVRRVIDFLIEQVPNNEYSKEIISTIDKIKTETKEEENDELLQEAIATVVSAEQASVSMLQRRFRIGYNRAARLIDFMEESGIIGPADGSRARKVLITKDELLELREIERCAKEQEEM
ncbi:MAG: DNA translocase FtsK 4TM domain-containing protein [Eubacteriales bacterium]